MTARTDKRRIGVGPLKMTVLRTGQHRRRNSLFITGHTVRDRDRARRWFKSVAAVAVLGYVLFDRAFAWIHIPGVPIFTGEILLMTAILVLIRNQQTTVELLRRSTLMRIAGLLLVWGLVRLAFDLPAWGIGALRDGAQSNYILVGLAMAVVVIDDPEIIGRLSHLRRWLPAGVVTWVPVAIFLSRRYSGRAPLVPDSETSILSFKPGDYAIFAAVAIAYVWISENEYSRRYRQVVTFVGVLGLLVAGSQNRGGLVGAVLLLSVATLFMRRSNRIRFILGSMLATGGLILVLLVSNLAIPLGSRSFSIGQLAENAVSLTGGSDSGNLSDTVSWRLDYWQLVVADVVTGESWLTGIGFGPSLADEYGFQTSSQGSTQPLRNAHNSHVTLVARLGVLGMLLWAAFWLRVGVMFNRFFRRRIAPIGGLMVAFIVGVGVAAIFDPVLEGPQMAIPFWCAVGVLAGSIATKSIVTSNSINH
jgi:hypothetical protein